VTTVHYRPAGKRAELLIPTDNEHVWIAMACFRVSAESLRGVAADQVNLDRENLAIIEVGCYVCEQGWSESLSYEKCPGEPT
jgi:hypothetical protein